jgi:hypothetical protein
MSLALRDLHPDNEHDFTKRTQEVIENKAKAFS